MGRRDRARAAAWLAAGLLGSAAWLAAAASAQVPATEPAGREPSAEEPPRIHSLTLQGVEQMDAGELRGVMRLAQRSWWHPLRKNYFYGLDYLELDLVRIHEHYRREGFLLARVVDATVDYPSRTWVDLTIRVEEGPRTYVRAARLEGASGDLHRRLAREVRIRRGEPLRESAVERDVLAIVRACGNRGHALAQVRPELRLRGDSAEVLYDLDPGPRVRVGRVATSGAEHTAPDVILREVVLKSGDLLRLDRAERSQDRLFDLGVFRSVQIVPRYEALEHDSAGPAEVSVDLDVRVQEKPPGWFGAGFGYSSRDRLRLSAEWGYRNLGGRARRVQAEGEISYSLEENLAERFKRPKEWQVELSYAAPRLLGKPTRWQLRPYFEHKRWFEESQAIEEDIVGVALRGRWDLARDRWLLGSLENKWTFGESDFVTRFISVSIAEDRRDFVLDPRSGYLHQAGAEHAGGILGGQTEFTRWTLGLAGYAPMSGGVTWARRLRAGYIHPYNVPADETPLASVPLSERFFTGGGTSVRGYEEESLGPLRGGTSEGGLVLLLVNTELRFPLFWKLGGVIFVDAGNVWADPDRITWSCLSGSWTSSEFSEEHIAYGTGAGLRFYTPVGPLRLDYGIKIGRGPREISGRDAEWHLNLGQAF